MMVTRSAMACRRCRSGSVAVAVAVAVAGPGDVSSDVQPPAINMAGISRQSINSRFRRVFIGMVFSLFVKGPDAGLPETAPSAYTRAPGGLRRVRDHSEIVQIWHRHGSGRNTGERAR